MCIIIDANQAHIISDVGRCPYYSEILKWIAKGGRVVSGGRLESELFRIGSMRALIVEWQRSGRLISIPSKALENVEKQLRSVCGSDDPHILALVQLSDAGVVVTRDKALICDLKNKEIVGRKIRIYKASEREKIDLRSHRKMLSDAQCS